MSAEGAAVQGGPIRCGASIRPGRVEALLTPLQNSRTVLLDGAPVAIAEELAAPRCTLTDDGAGLLLTFEANAHLTEVLALLLAPSTATMASAST